MSEIKNGKLGLSGAEHSKCYHMTTVGFKGLKLAKLSADGVFVETDDV